MRRTIVGGSAAALFRVRNDCTEVNRVPGSASARSWIRRAVLGIAAVALLVFGLRANGNTAAELVTNDAMVWLANPPGRNIVQVHGRSRDVAETVDVPRASDSIVARQLGTGALVLDQGAATVGRVDGVSLQYAAGRKVGTSGADLAIAVGGQRPYVIDTAAGRIEALDPKSLDPVADSTITPQQAAVAVVGADGRLWAYDRETGEILAMDPNGEVARQKVTDAGTPAALALADSRPVLVESTKGQVHRLSGSGKPGASACLASSGSENVLVAGSGGGAPDPLAFTIFTDTGELSTSNLEDGSCVRLQLRSDDASGDDVYGQPVALGEILFVPLLNRGQVLVIDGARNTIERTITNLVSPNHRFELFVDDGNVWFNDLEGAAAGVLSPGGLVFTVDKNTASSRTGGTGQGDGPGVGTDPDGEIVDNDPDAGTDAPGEGGADGGSSTDGNGTEGDGDGAGAGSNGTGSGRGQGRGSDTGNARTDAGAQTRSDAAGAAAGEGLEKLPAPSAGSSAVGISPAPAAPPGVVPPAPSGPTPAPNTSVPGQTAPTTPPPADTLSANFSWSPAGQPDVNTTLDFVDTSVGRVTQWVWSFTGPDGSSTTAQGPRVSRTLPQPGNWSVTLTVTNGTRVDTTRPALIAVREAGAPTPPVADFTWEPQTPVVDTPVVFRDRSTSLGVGGGIVSWLWDFGDGTTAAIQNPPSKVYTKPDTYIVRLTVRNALRLEAKAEVRIVVAAKPEQLKPDFTFSPASPRVGDTVEFRDTTIGGPTSWQWDLGDGTTARTQNVAIRYRDQGDFKVSLTVRNERGTELVQKTVRVGAAVNAPQARISQPSGTATVEVGKSLRFVSGSTGAPTKLVWDFGDGSAKVEGTSVDKTWTRTGRYTVTLTASNDVGSTSTSMDVEVTVSQPVPIEAAFRVSPGATRAEPATVDSPVLFTNLSTGQGTYSWEFGDGATSTQTQPTHTYTARGTYTVTLKMTSGDRVSTAQRDVFVVERVVRPRAAFSFSPASPAANQTITFTDESQNAPTSWRWDFGDGSSTRSEQNPTKVYANAGTYFVTLTVRNDAGEDTDRQVLQVTVPRPPPTAAFDIAPAAAERFAGAALTFTDRTDANRPLTTPVFTFPNGSLSPAAGQRSVQYTFAQAGTFPVTMRVCWADEPQNCNDVTQSVTILQPATKPTAAFTLSGPGVINQTTIAAGRPVTFTDASTGANITRREWNIGGSRYDTTSVTLTLTSPGQLSVTLTVTNAGGSDAATRSVAVVAAPAASFDAPTSALTGVPVSFTDTSTGYITSWTWDFGDGNTFTTSDPARRSPQHTYATSGTYVVRLRVSNDADQSTATPKSINITVPVPPSPVIQATDPTTGTTSSNGAISVRAGVNVQFIDASTGAPATSWVWQWGDNTPNTEGAQATHAFAAAGSYVVQLVATNTGGSREATLTVTVTPPVAAASSSTSASTTSTTTGGRQG